MRLEALEDLSYNQRDAIVDRAIYYSVKLSFVLTFVKPATIWHPQAETAVWLFNEDLRIAKLSPHLKTINNLLCFIREVLQVRLKRG